MDGSCVVFDLVVFFKQKTAYEMRISDWSSDVCSSDLLGHLDQRHVAKQRDVEFDERFLDVETPRQRLEIAKTADARIGRVPDRSRQTANAGRGGGDIVGGKHQRERVRGNICTEDRKSEVWGKSVSGTGRYRLSQ